MKKYAQALGHSPLIQGVWRVTLALACAAALSACGDDEGDTNKTYITNPPPTEAPAAVYRDGTGNLITIDSSSIEPGKVVFYAWLQDLVGEVGIDPTKLTVAGAADPGEPSLLEQAETAPSFTQNLAAAWVGIKDGGGIVRPVIGANVRWEIDQLWSERLNSMQFGSSDDNNSILLGYGIHDDQADTVTNNGQLKNDPWPFAVGGSPLFNQTGVSSPLVDGFTWVTLYSPDREAKGRIVAVATIDGAEIGKQVLVKNFEPVPKVTIEKSVDKPVVNLVNGSATATWTINIKNIGIGDAESVDLKDVLASGNGLGYTLGSLPEGATPLPLLDGFTHSFPLASGATETLTATATVTAPGTYCNAAQVLTYRGTTSAFTPVELTAQACFTALEANLSIVKDFVADDDTTSLGATRSVAANVPVKQRVRVTNNGDGDATGVQVADALATGNAATYDLISVSPGTPNASDGFDYTIGTLAAGASATMLLTVKGSADGVYCDKATLSAESGNIPAGADSSTACLTVATANLTIAKANDPQIVDPGATYTSTIVVNNTGTATATGVVISDSLGLNAATNVRAVYQSSSLGGASGTLAGNIVTANTVDIPAGGSQTFTVVSQIPSGASSGQYCDTANVTSSNAGSANDEVCVNVPAFAAQATQLVDKVDPVRVGNNETYAVVLSCSKGSNEGVGNNVITFSFGLPSPTDIGQPGAFQSVSTRVWLDTNPVQDPQTGFITSDPTNPTAVLKVAGTDYTLNNSTAGLQVLTMTPGTVLQPGTALYVEQVVLVPSGIASNRQYTTSLVWKADGLISTIDYQGSSSEPTTVLP